MTGSKLPAETKLEKVAGSLPTSIAATLIAAFDGTPITALLPVLTAALASGRHTKRVEQAIEEISTDLEEVKEDLRLVSDSQYKLINESVLAVFQSTDDEKLMYLRRAVRNAVAATDITPQEADFLSRVVRDMSAEEARFLVKNSGYDRVQLAERPSPGLQGEVLTIDPSTDQALIVSGLISLGLLIPGEPTWDGAGLMRFSAVVSPLVELLSESN